MQQDPVRQYCIYKTKLSGEYTKIVESENNENTCPETLEGGWKLYTTFYAISDSYNKISDNMSLISVKIAQEYPYNTVDLFNSLDFFDEEDDAVRFITYTKKLPNTFPLYFYNNGDNNMSISWDPDPPKLPGVWTQQYISPIYVMKEHFTKFICINGRPIPWNEELSKRYSNDIFNTHQDLPPANFDKATNECNYFRRDYNTEILHSIQQKAAAIQSERYTSLILAIELSILVFYIIHRLIKT